MYGINNLNNLPPSLNKIMTTCHYKHTSHNSLRNVKEFTEHILYASQDTSHAKHQVIAIIKHNAYNQCYHSYTESNQTPLLYCWFNL